MNKTNKARFNIADILIIFVVIAIIAALALRVYNVYILEDETTILTVEFEISELSSDFIGLNENDTLYLSSDDSEVGTITSVTVEDAVRYAYTEDGTLVKATVRDKSTVKGTMKMSGIVNERGFLLGGNVLLTEGGTVNLYTQVREFTIKIVKIGS